jgi:predicted histidine transporter YuiF (NhaC family)
MACMLVTIGTVSSISAIPITCYLLAGLAVGYALRPRATEQPISGAVAFAPALAGGR